MNVALQLLMPDRNPRKEAAACCLALLSGLLANRPSAAQRAVPRGPSTVTAAVEAALRKLDDTQLQDIRKREVKFVDEVYAPDVALFPIYGPLKFEGRDGAREAWQSFYDRFAEIKRSDWSERVYRIPGSASAWMTCLWSLQGTNSDGQELELILRVTRHYEKRQGRWMVVHEHFSAPQR